MTKLAIWWIRRDLRLTDNQALQAALEQSEAILPLFILDHKLLDSPWVGEKRTAFLFAGLVKLDEQLRDKGGALIVRRGSPQQVFHKLSEEIAEANLELVAIHAQADCSPYAKQRDQGVAKEYPLILHDGIAIRPIGTVNKDDGDPYVVFTPYAKRWLDEPPIAREGIISAPKAVKIPSAIASDSLPNVPDLAATLPFTAGEAIGKERLGNFVKGDDAPIFRYAAQRDLPFNDATSHLSPYLRFGMISPRLAALGAYTARGNASSTEERNGAQSWLSELIWRDFYLTILTHYPHVRQGAFRAEYDALAWENDEVHFAAWCDGETGYPFVDAAMRQLKTSGWMHNRARMVVGSFLVKDLLIDWRWGERWFMQQLVDGDPAANNGGWQWVAGTGTDAAPYFRIFNPLTQSEKFDPKGNYIRHWIPALRAVSDKFIHAPWKMSETEQQRVQCKIGKEYPEPIIDHKWARERTLEAYKAIKG